MIKQGMNILKEHKKNRLDFNPKLQQINFLDRRVYKRADGVYYPSVTTILQYMPKARFFEEYLKNVGHNADIILQKAGKEGTQVHDAAEKLIRGEEVTWMDDFGNAKYSQLVWEMILRFYDFWETYNPKPLFVEEFVYSDIYQYAGTVDLVIEIGGEKWLLDIKTSNVISKGYDLQLAAYAKAFEEIKGIHFDKVGILWLKANTRSKSKREGTYQGRNWQVKFVENIDQDFELFQNIYSLYKTFNPTTEPLYQQYPTVLKF